MSARRSYRRTTILMIGCVGLLVGLAFTRFGNELSTTWLLVLSPMLFVVLPRKDVFTIFSVFALMFVIGHIRGQSFMTSLSPYQELNGKKVTILAVADTDAQYNDRKQFEFEVTKINIVEPKYGKVVGKMKIAGFGINSVFKGDNLHIEGKLYQTRGSKQASIGFATIGLESRNDSAIDKARREFAAGVSNVLPDPQAPFGLGLLIGQKTTLGEDATAWLSMVGLTHIIAVSGYNLTIIVRFVHRIFGKRSRYQTVLYAFVIIGLFLLTTGFSASIVRAAIVCGLSLVAWYYGRKFKPLLILLLTAAITAFWYPVYLWSDIGWYLSFLAFFGVLILAPLITIRLFRRQPKPLTSAVIESFCAQLMTAPLIMYIFGQFSTVSLVSNMLVVVLIPLAMLFTLMAGIAGMINPAGLAVLALPAKILLSYILYVAYILSQIPHSVVDVGISVLAMSVFYAAIIIITMTLWSKTKDNHDIITDETLI